MNKFKLLIVDKDGLVLPKGHISAVLPPGIEPSDYERSPNSPWKIKEVTSNPILPRGKRKDLLKRESPDPDETTIFDKNNQFKNVKRKDHYKKPKSKADKKAIKAHPHPELKKGSLIWDFGPGRTYSNPQAAFDAMLAFWGSNPITENQILRGYSGTYAGTGGIVLHVHDLNVPQGFDLTLDVEPGQDVKFQSNFFQVMGALTESLETVINNFKVKGPGLTIINDYAGGIGIANQFPSFLGSVQSGHQLTVEDVIIKAGDGVFPTTSIGIFSAGCSFANIYRNKILGFLNGIGDKLGFTIGNWTGQIKAYSNIINAFQAGFYINQDSGQLQLLVSAHNLVKAAYFYEKFDANRGFLAHVNDVAVVDFVRYTPNIPAYSLFETVTDGNTYLLGADHSFDKNGNVPMSFFQTNFQTELNSQLADPLLDESDMTLDEASPAFRSGIAVGFKGIDGVLISRTMIDAGPYQPTQVRVYKPDLCGYCTVQDVIESTGVIPENLDLVAGDDKGLSDLLCQWIAQVSDLIDKYCETSWVLGSQPEGVRRSSIIMMSKVVAVAVQRRKSPFIKITDFSVKMVADDLFSQDVTILLDEYKEPELSVDYNGDIGIGVSSAPGDEEDGL